MIRSVLMLLLLNSLTSVIYGQNNFCGADQVHESLMQNNPQYRDEYLNYQAQVRANISTFSNQRGGSPLYTIPVVVHIVHLGEPVGTGSNLSDADVHAAIDGLNNHYANVFGNSIDVEIEFCLAVRDPDGNPTSGINRVNGSGVPLYTTYGLERDTFPGAYELDIKDLSIWPNEDYYNIWVVHQINGWIAGYAYYPTSYLYEGTVIEYTSMNYNSIVLTHELGHALNIAHTFEGDDLGCPDDTDCSVDGDGVCDTPPHTQNDCGLTNPCSVSGIWDNSKKNIMSYCSSRDRFTNGQKTRMHASISTHPYRISLLNSLACVPVECIGSSACNDSSACTYDICDYGTCLHFTGDTWIEKESFPGSGRLYAVTFVINDKIYIGTGRNNSYLKDFWEFDPATNIWSQKADFGGVARIHAAGFSIGNKGYIGTGYDGVARLRDFWEYDSVTDTWTQKGDFSAGVRNGIFGFSMNNKGYFAFGASNTAYNKDLWEYNPSNDTWVQKATLPSNGRELAAGFVIGNKVYIGTGYAFTELNDFWEYDLASNSWTQKTDFTGGERFGAAAFSIGNKGYLGSGRDDTGTNTKDFWEYNPVTDMWVQKGDYGGLATYSASKASVGNKGYIGMGQSGENTLWEYYIAPCDDGDPCTIDDCDSTGCINIPLVCDDGNLCTTDSCSGGTCIFTPINCDDNNSCTIDSCNNGVCFNYPAAPYHSVLSISICEGDFFMVGTSSYNVAGTYVDSLLTVSGCDSIITTHLSVLNTTSSNISPTICQGESLSVGGSVYTNPGVYVKTIPGSNGCDSVITINLTVLPSPTVSLQNFSVCQGDSVVIDAGNPGEIHQWSTGATTKTIMVSTSGNYSVVVTNQDNCTGYDNSTVEVNPLPVADAGTDDTICIGASTNLIASGGVNYSWSNGQLLQSIMVSPLTDTRYDVTVTDANGCVDVDAVRVIVDSCLTSLATIESENLLKIYPNPTSSNINIHYETNSSNEVSLKIINVNGKTVFAQTSVVVHHEVKESINLIGYAKGLYFLQLTDNDVNMIRKVILK